MSKEHRQPATADRLNKIEPYLFDTLNKLKAEVEAKSGRKVLDFGAGSPDFPPSQIYIEMLGEYIREPGAHLYPGYGAIPELAEAIPSWYRERFAVSLERNEFTPLLGAKDGIAHFPLGFLNPKDEILIPDPGYPAFADPTIFADAIPTRYNLLPQNDFKIDYQDIKSKIGPKTDFIWVNFPSNPTGQVSTLSELEKLVHFANKEGLYIIYDNAYSEITFDGFRAPSILQVHDAKDLAIEICSFSKTFSFAGYRMGYVAGNKEIVAGIAKLKTQIDSGMTKPLQKMGAYALTHFDNQWYQSMIASYQNRGETIIQYLKTLEIDAKMPQGSLYLWAKIPKGAESSEQFSRQLLEEK